ncbi:MAG: hypothetical protein ACK4QW_11355 [Alphaproteobacteria bacterium]
MTRAADGRTDMRGAVVGSRNEGAPRMTGAADGRTDMADRHDARDD